MDVNQEFRGAHALIDSSAEEDRQNDSGKREQVEPAHGRGPQPGYLIAGLWTPAVSRFYLLSLPGVILAIFLGRRINQRMSSAKFLIYVHAGLILIGAVLLLQAFKRYRG